MNDDDGLREATVRAVDAVARDAIFWGCSPLKLWTQVATRIVAAARTSTGAQEWSGRVLRGMRVQTPSVACSRALTDLAIAVGVDHDRWLSMVEREAGFIVASVRARRDVKKAKKKVAAEEAAAIETAEEYQESLWNK